MNSTTKQSIKIPYPLIFIHGLIGNDTSWTDMKNYLSTYQGLVYGGNMDFCLNKDNNLNTSSFQSDYKDYTSLNNQLQVGDFYTINFDIDHLGRKYTGSTQNQSNQSATYKQGRAIRDAVKYVLQKSGRDKVILIGHSMGGLAAREYLSNTSIWQTDGKHHIAKFYSIVTPHGGSNATSFGLSGFFVGLDESSEAVRDLRTSYYYSYNSGAQLFGGIESNSYMWDRLLFNFYNVDVNCNGFVGETILGLNYKYSPNDIYYSCSIGYGISIIGEYLYGDGVVAAYKSDMNNYMSFQPPLMGFTADTFMVTGNSSLLNPLHVQLTKNNFTYLNAKGFDEPWNKNHAYNILFDSTYYGNITYPSKGLSSNINLDTDIYKFSSIVAGNVKMEINNIPLNNVYYSVSNRLGTISIGGFTSGKGSIDTTFINLPPDNYYFSISGNPTTYSYYFPYSYKLSFTPITSIVQQPISQTVCGGNFATFSVSVTGVGPFSYRWNNGSTNSNMTTSIVGSYFVTVTGLNGTIVSTPASLQNLNCVTVSAPVIVKQPISQTICGGNFATFSVSVSGLGSMSYKWNNGALGNNLTTSTPGIYLVTVTGINGVAISNPATLTSKNCTITQIEKEDIDHLEINVYPNPAEDELTVYISKLGTDNTIELFNELGVLVLKIKVADSSLTFDLKNLTKGFYIISIKIDNDFRKLKLLKE